MKLGRRLNAVVAVADEAVVTAEDEGVVAAAEEATVGVADAAGIAETVATAGTAGNPSSFRETAPRSIRGRSTTSLKILWSCCVRVALCNPTRFRLHLLDFPLRVLVALKHQSS